jgi:hypothetical protein
MRAPSAAPAVYALECAMDKLAVALKLDPLELRLRCYSERDQHTDRPYSSKSLRDCYRQGAEAFGWDKRNPEPRSMRDSHMVVYGIPASVTGFAEGELSQPSDKFVGGKSTMEKAVYFGPGTPPDPRPRARRHQDPDIGAPDWSNWSAARRA